MKHRSSMEVTCPALCPKSPLSHVQSSQVCWTGLCFCLPKEGWDCQKVSLSTQRAEVSSSSEVTVLQYNRMTHVSAVFDWSVSEKGSALKLTHPAYPAQTLHRDSLSSLALEQQVCLNYINHSSLWKIGHSFRNQLWKCVLDALLPHSECIIQFSCFSHCEAIGTTSMRWL